MPTLSLVAQYQIEYNMIILFFKEPVLNKSGMSYGQHASSQMAILCKRTFGAPGGAEACRRKERGSSAQGIKPGVKRRSSNVLKPPH